MEIVIVEVGAPFTGTDIGDGLNVAVKPVGTLADNATLSE